MLYAQTDVMRDLLQFVARRLRLKGRFVYLLPATIDFEAAKDLPRHPCLKVIANSEQRCQDIFRRRLITMEKWREFGARWMRPKVPAEADFADLKKKLFEKQ